MFACTEKLPSTDELTPGKCSATEFVLGAASKGEAYCLSAVWVYDRGALRPHDMPDDAGFRVGAGSPFTKFFFQVHYLLPKEMSAAQLYAAGYEDHSGVRVVLSRNLRPFNTNMLAFYVSRSTLRT